VNSEQITLEGKEHVRFHGNAIRLRSILLRTAVLCLLAALMEPLAGRAMGSDPRTPAKGHSILNEVQPVLDLPYYQGKDADPIKHKLDLYLPRGQKDFPVLFFVHGGGWRHGDKKYLGIYSTLGMFWARHGIGAVITNYRLTPTVNHPAHIKDVARAFAWTYQNIGKYGGRADEIFVSGHSAGGHLVALLATDDSYLKAEGLTLAAIRGAIPMSGIYDLSDGNRLFTSTFGAKMDLRQEASPLAHVRPDAPPFLIVYGDNDLTLCGKECSETFCRALCNKKCDARTLEAHDRNHFTILLMAALDDDPVARAILEFIALHAPTNSSSPMATGEKGRG
jgi:acetyl esterase/lipase